jgi:aspartyl-tRNA(Asn)/glutamyl-tRNA(Gln) amidotransferase subunit B
MDAPAKKSKLIKGATGDWEVVIGLEVHAQVTSEAKLFSGASTAFGGEPNSHVSLVDAAMPGMLPVINGECVRQAVRTGIALNATINPKSVFDRKNYFYPDLPQGYQISQYKWPIVSGGEVLIETEGGGVEKIGIERIHLEQDAGKLQHEQNPTMSLVDLNRAGVALMEIVSKPEIRSFDDAMNFVAKLRIILRYLGACDGDMENGRLRADVNVSINRPGEPLGTRCEIKNLNSINFIGQAIFHEQHRQMDILEAGGKIVQETRLYDPIKDETRSMRTKEEAHDYRYFPDPDLLPLEITNEYIDDLRETIPEMQDQKVKRFCDNFGLSKIKALRLARERSVAEAFEANVFGYVRHRHGPEAAALTEEAYGIGSERLRREDYQLFANKRQESEQFHKTMIEGSENICNFILGPIFAKANETGRDPVDYINKLNLPQILAMVLDGIISSQGVKQLFEIVWAAGGGDLLGIVEREGLRQMTDLSAIEKIVDDVLAKNPDKVADAKANPKAIGWFVGQVMKASGGKANPQAVNDLLKKKIGI